MKHYDECPSSYHCVCSIIRDRNKYKRAIQKALKHRKAMKSYPFPDYAASMTAELTAVIKD